MLEFILAITVLGLLAAEIALLAVLATALMRRRGESKPSAQENAATADTPAQEKPKPGSIDEGFENIMQYAVRGRNGFDADER